MKRRSVEGSRIFLRTRINHGTSSRSVFGAEKEEDKRDDERRREMVGSRPCPKFHAPPPPPPFSPVDACACYGHHAAPPLPPPPRPGEMITTPNRLRGERRSTRVARVDKEVADGAKGVLKLVAKRPGRFVPLSDLFEEEPPRRRRAARLETKRLVCLSYPLLFSIHPLLLSHSVSPSPRSPSHPVTLFLFLYYYVFAIYLCLHPPPFYFLLFLLLLLRCSVRRCWFVRESSASYRTSLARTPLPAGASLSQESAGPPERGAAPATRDFCQRLLSTSSWG